VIILLASGKGGTGKTTVAVSLALSLVGGDGGGPISNDSELPPLLVDCDVEAPNAAFFLSPAIQSTRPAGVLVPQVVSEACTLCGRCAEVCRYHALAVIARQVLLLPELCHGCGSCSMNCPEGAIEEVLNRTGHLEKGRAGGLDFARGVLDIGEPMAVPLIRQLKEWVVAGQPRSRPIVLDAPPGSSCPVVESMRGADFVALVTEPTPYGLHDLRLAVEVARDELGLPVGVVLNREGIGDEGVERYCEAEGLPIMMRIPHDRAVAEAYARGIPLVEAQPAYRERFRELYAEMCALAGARRARREGVGTEP
jgi:MinD superfamily P-loop ATPase